ncbi:MAG: glycosyltransferase family 4 protein [Ferrimicrobium sp.]
MDIPGGVQGQVRMLAESFSLAGNEVLVAAPGDRPSDIDAFVTLGPTRSVAANGSRAPVAMSLTTLGRVRRLLNAYRFDVVHLHEPCTPLVGPAVLYWSKAPVVGTFHRSGLGRGYQAYGHVLSPLTKRLRRRIGVSLEAEATGRSVVGGSFQVISNGVDVKRYSLSQDPVTREDTTLLFVGRHEQRKGLQVLLEAFSRLRLVDSLRLVVVGEGPETARLRASYAMDPRIEWVGAVSQRDLVDWMHRAGIVVVPSLFGESFGVVLIEAMAAGAVVVASDLPGYRSVLEGGRAGIVVPPGDHVALARALDDLIGDGERVGRLRIAGLERSMDFDGERVAERYYAVFGNLFDEEDG